MPDVIDPALWAEIASDQANDGIIVRRIAPQLEHDVFIGERRPSRERVLILEIKGDPKGLPLRLASSRGLDVKIDSSDRSATKIRLTSTSAANNSLFTDLADDVVTLLLSAPSECAAARVVERISAWQIFFAHPSSGLSAESAAGLFAELAILELNILPALGALSAVQAWSGADPALQDFQWRRTALEVKSFRGLGSGHLSISSERQLETIGVRSLFIAYVRLDQRTEGDGTTLAETIDALRTKLQGTVTAAHLLDTKLRNYGWRPSYAKQRPEKYRVRSVEFFRIRDGFPRILPADLISGVGHVSYRVDRSALDPFLVPWHEVECQLKEHP